MASKQTHCKKGHELSGDNLHFNTRGERQCKECKKSSDKNWRDLNPEKSIGYKVAYYIKNKQEAVDRATAWNKAHPEYTKRRGAKYKRDNPEKDRALQAKRRAQKTQAGGYYTAEEWFVLCFACGFKCLCCGQTKPLQGDHVLPICKGGSSWLHNIQPLCGECNRHKGRKHIDYRTTQGDLWQTNQEFWILQALTQPQ